MYTRRHYGVCEYYPENAFGSVQPYTRHLAACPHGSEKNYNQCNCPKWLYVRPGKSKKERYLLATPSWAEANLIAADKLRAMDPEIAAASSVKEQEKQDRLSVPDAWQLWLDRTERKFRKWGVYPQYASLKKIFERWA